MNSKRYDVSNDLCIPHSCLFLCLARAHIDSTWLVVAWVTGSTMFTLWFTVKCWCPRLPMVLYALHGSHNSCTRSDILLQYWQQCSRILLWYCHQKTLMCSSVSPTKNPLRAHFSTNVVFFLRKADCQFQRCVHHHQWPQGASTDTQQSHLWWNFASSWLPRSLCQLPCAMICKWLSLMSNYTFWFWLLIGRTPDWVSRQCFTPTKEI